MLEPLKFVSLTLSFFRWEKLRPEGAVTGLKSPQVLGGLGQALALALSAKVFKGSRLQKAISAMSLGHPNTLDDLWEENPAKGPMAPPCSV